MKLKLRANRVAVAKIKKAPKGGANALGIVLPEADEYVGIIKYVGESASADLIPGCKVYFSTNHQVVRIAGIELCVMEDSQIFAVVEE